MKNLKTRLLSLFVIVLATPTFAQQVWWVDDDAVPGGDGSSLSPFQTIQAGINAATSGVGDFVIVRRGIYFETIDFGGKAIRVRSGRGPLGAKIDARNLGASAVTFQYGEGPQSVLQGFTIQSNSGTAGFGGGILCTNDSSPRIIGNVIEGCDLSIEASRGGGIACLEGSSPWIEGNIIRDNLVGSASFSVPGEGGGLYCENGSPTLLRNTFSQNFASWTAGAMFFKGDCSPVIESNVIADNWADDYIGAIRLDSGSPYFLNNLIVRNSSEAGSAITAGSGTNLVMVNCTVADNYSFLNTPGMSCGGSARVVNSIFWGNERTHGGDGTGVTQLVGGGIVVNYSDIQNGPVVNDTVIWGSGMLSADPAFVNGYYLSQVAAGQAFDSPCLDAGARRMWRSDWSTRTDHVPDAGMADLGYHAF